MDIDKLLSDAPRAGKYLPKVEIDADLKRVYQLPRRVWQDDRDLPELRDLLTASLRTPTGTMRLNAAQAQFLRDVYERGGALVPCLPGSGKTLMSLLR